MAEDIQQQVIALIAAFNASGRLKKGVAITGNRDQHRAQPVVQRFQHADAPLLRYLRRRQRQLQPRTVFPAADQHRALVFPSACKEHPRPLCVSMLVRSARAKRWLYDIHFLIEQLR